MRLGRPKNPPNPTPRECVDELHGLVMGGLSKTKAYQAIEKKYGHHPEAMRAAYDRHFGEEEVFRHGNAKFSDEDEEAIVGTLQAFGIRGTILPSDQVFAAIHAEFGNKVSAPWYSRFLDRHGKELARRRKGLQPVSTSLRLLPQETERFCDKLEKYHEKYYFPAHAKVTADEARLLIKDGHCHFLLVGERGGSFSKLKWVEKDTIGSYIVFGTATGKVLFSVYVFRLKPDRKGTPIGEFFLPNITRTTRSSHPRYYIFTKSSYVDAAAWASIMDFFTGIWGRLYPGLHCELYLDHLGAHAQADTVLKARRNGIHTMLLVKKSTPAHSPLDQAPIALMRNFSTKFAHEGMVAAFLLGESTDGVVFQAVFKAEGKAFTPKVLVAAWKKAGLHPYAREVLIRRAHELAGEARATTTPESLAAEMAGRVLDAQKPFEPRKKQRAAVETGKVYTPDDMQQLVFEKERAKAEKDKLKRQLLEEKCRRKEEREAVAKRTKEDRARRKRERERVRLKRESAKRLRAEESARKAKEKGKKEKEEAERIVTETCMSCGARWRGGEGWQECELWETCGFTQCPQCWRKRGNELLEHETVCKLRM